MDDHLRNQRGIALVAVLVIAAVALPLSAFLALQALIDLRIGQNLRSATETFYVAEAGLQHALAQLRPAASFDLILAGPDGVGGTADDGVFPFAGGAPASFPRAPLRYEVSAALADDGSLRLRSRGIGADGAEKIVEARVAHSHSVYTPGALYAGTAPQLDSARSYVSGFDHRAGDPAREPTGEARPVPGIGVPSGALADAVRAQLPDSPRPCVVGAGDAPSVAEVWPLDVDSQAAAFERLPGAVRMAAVAPPADWNLGTVETPQLTVVIGDLEVSGHLSGDGVLIIYGEWRVTGEVSYSGLIIAMGEVTFEPQSHVSLTGALWHAGSAPLAFLGDDEITYSSEALSRADAAFPAVLPRAPAVIAWREVL
jgi:hypothetical protein